MGNGPLYPNMASTDQNWVGRIGNGQQPVATAPVTTPPATVVPDKTKKPNTATTVAPGLASAPFPNIALGPSLAGQFPRMSGLVSDTADQMRSAGSIPEAFGRGIAGTLAQAPAFAADVGAMGAPLVSGIQNFTRGVSPPLSQAVFAPTAAETAAKAAATKAATTTNAPFESGYQDTANPRGQPESDASNANWNAFVSHALPAAALPPSSTQQNGLPSWTKQAGEAALNAGGAPRLGDYGYGSQIVMSGKGVGGKFNTFTGVGTGAAPAGAAGVFGAQAGGQSARDIQAGFLQRANLLSQQGFNRGAIELRRQAAAMSGQVAAEMQHKIATWQTGIQAGVQLPQAQMGAMEAAALSKGDFVTARKLAAARAGQSLNPVQSLPGMSYIRNADTDQPPQWLGFPQSMMAPKLTAPENAYEK